MKTILLTLVAIGAITLACYGWKSGSSQHPSGNQNDAHPGQQTSGVNKNGGNDIIMVKNAAGKMVRIRPGDKQTLVFGRQYDPSKTVKLNSNEYLMELVVVEENVYSTFSLNYGSREYNLNPVASEHLLEPANDTSRTELAFQGGTIRTFNLKLHPPYSYEMAHADYRIGTILPDE